MMNNRISLSCNGHRGAFWRGSFTLSIVNTGDSTDGVFIIVTNRSERVIDGFGLCYVYSKHSSDILTSSRAAFADIIDFERQKLGLVRALVEDIKPIWGVRDLGKIRPFLRRAIGVKIEASGVKDVSPIALIIL